MQMIRALERPWAAKDHTKWKLFKEGTSNVVPLRNPTSVT